MKYCEHLLSIIGFSILISTQCISAQTNYYVSTTGSNSDSDGESTPWLTIQYGADQLSAGDTLNLKAGTYAGKIDCNVSGTASQRITIRNYEQDLATIDGINLNNYEYLFKIENQDYITLQGLQFADFQKLDAQGVVIINSSGVTLQDNEFINIDYASNALGQTPNSTQNSQPIIVYGRDQNNPITDLLILNNEIHDCEVGYSECLSVNGNVDGFQVLANHIYDNTNIGIVAIGHEGECPDPAVDQARNGTIANNLVHDNPSAYAAAAGVYVDGGKSILINKNWSYNNDYGIEIGCENNGGAPNDPSTSDVTVTNNVLYNNGVTGIALGGYDYPTTGKVETTIIRNNTLYGNDTGNTYSGEFYITYVETSTIENNIISATNSDNVVFISDSANPTLSLNHNLYYSPSGADDMTIEVNGVGYYEFSTYQSATGQDGNSQFDDPQFLDTNLGTIDIHISDTSPAKDLGNPTTIVLSWETDIDNEQRVSGTIDCGADEYYPTTGVHIYIESEDICIFPNPFTDKVNIAGTLGDYEIKVFDGNGALVADYSSSSSPLTIDLTALGAGTYFLSLQHDTYSEQSVYKIIKN